MAAWMTAAGRFAAGLSSQITEMRKQPCHVLWQAHGIFQP